MPKHAVRKMCDRERVIAKLAAEVKRAWLEEVLAQPDTLLEVLAM